MVVQPALEPLRKSSLQRHGTPPAFQKSFNDQTSHTYKIIRAKTMAALEVVDEDSTTDIQIFSRNIPSTIGGAGIYISSPGTENLQISLPLGATFSSYNAEIAAASSAFENLPDLAANSHVLWCTDSQSVLDALQGNTSKAGPQTQLFWDNIRSKLDKKIAITAVWVPAHCGIPENELADQLATKATKRPFSEHCVSRLAPEVVKTFTRRKQLSKLISFRDDVKYKLTVSRRKAEVTLNQLRANYSPLNRDFDTAENYDPICQACLLRVPETVDHLLRRCPGRTFARRKHLGPNSRATIEDLCTKYPMQVLEFFLDEDILRDPSPSKFG